MTATFRLRVPRRNGHQDDLDRSAAWAAVDAEVRRSRRHSRPFVLLAVPGRGEIARAIRPLLRAPDRAWVDDGKVYILLSDCDAAGATGFINRTRQRLPGLLTPGDFGLGVFPTDGVTLGGLIEAASRPRKAMEVIESGAVQEPT